MFSRIESYIAQLQADPVAFLITMAYTWGVILFSLILHECAHGYVALKCGDPTAKMLGRLSLNPARHLDPLGTLCMFVLGFGWAKPVPVNPRNFRDFRRDDFFVSIAGITVNLTIFIAAVLLSCIVNRFLWTQEMLDIMAEEFGEIDILLNPYYGWVLTFTGLEGSVGASSIMNDGHEMIAAFGEFMRYPWLIWVQRLLLLLAQVNLTLAVFNLLPFPPLDGFHVLNDTLLKGKLRLNYNLHRITHALLMVLLLTGVLTEVLHFLTSNLYEAVLRVFMMLTGQM
ncbi:MAG: site-2 protease family protein [Clostridiales bacterium]|nr:site-2 protease family protein [Clostridiales bacterium]